jgi:hypothetical protein
MAVCGVIEINPEEMSVIMYFHATHHGADSMNPVRVAGVR